MTRSDIFCLLRAKQQKGWKVVVQYVFGRSKKKRLKGNALGRRLTLPNENLLASYSRKYISESDARQGFNESNLNIFR
jgi:hypothetical protein